MTKDWDTVQDEIKELSWVQKKRLDEVRKIMESRHGFKASTRAYRMKLAEWGFTRKEPRRATRDRGMRKRRRTQEDADDDAEGSDSDSTFDGTSQQGASGGATTTHDPENLETLLLGRANVQAGSAGGVSIDPSLGLLDESGDLLPTTMQTDTNRPTLDPWSQGSAVTTGVVMSMLAAVLEGDSQKLEALIMKHPKHINLPVGLPFEAHGGRFFNHPAMNECVILQHPDQTLFDIACGLPSGPVIWVLLSHGGKGTKHPLGTDLAFHNAIKNGRTYTVQALLMPGRSSINGVPGTTWKPLLQAVYWNQPEVVRILIDRGANINDTSPWLNNQMKSALQHCLDRRVRDYLNRPIKENCDKILKMLLNAGADIHLRPGGETISTPFETFLKPWQGDPHWIAKLSTLENECLEAFVRKGADLKTSLFGFTCTSPSSSTFEHQVLWHATPIAARLLIDHASPNPDGNGCHLLHEIVGSCPDAKRHPADTLRDVEVLLKRGADPNLLDDSNFTPLRRCIERCPAVDIIPRLQMLLEGGADPELKHSNRLPPFVLASRTFDEPLRSQVMDYLVAKIKGRQNRVVYDDTFTWAEGYFPIPDDPTWAQVQWYNGQNGDFNANVDRMVPEDVRRPFQRACYSVASMNFLNATTTRAKMNQPLSLSPNEKDEIFQAVAQRQASDLPEYRFDQGFVMGLLKPQMAPVLTNYPITSSSANEYMLPHQTPILSMAPSAPDISATAPADPPADPHSRRSSISSASSSASFIPTTTLIRWPDVGRPTLPGDIKRAKDRVLKYTCSECGGTNLLTKAELEKHGVEHRHSRECVEDECMRRFCVGRRGGMW